jgi:hypothetical protein
MLASGTINADSALMRAASESSPLLFSGELRAGLSGHML